MTIAVDFDGTIVRSNYPIILGKQPYAGEVLKKLYVQGHYIIIRTCRYDDQLLKAIDWLLEYQILFDCINGHNPESVTRYGEEGNKVYVHCYIDDKSLFGFPGWPACMAEIERVEAEYRSFIPR